jgi:hypothetical protein
LGYRTGAELAAAHALAGGGWVVDQSESRSLGFLEVLWTGFRVWVGSFSWFLLISLAVSVPLIYLCAVVVGPSDRYAQWSEVRNPFWLLRGALCLLGLFIGASVFCTVLGNAVFLGPVGRRAKEASGEFPGAPNWSIRKAFALLLASAATTVTILVGLVLFIVPGVIWSVRLAFVGQVIAAEGVGFFGAFERSRELASLRPGKATAIVMLSSGLFCLLSWAYGSTLALPGLWGLPDLVQPLVVLPLVLPFVSACFSLLYFDARCAEEGRACSVRVRGGHPLLQLVLPVSVVVLWPLIEPRVIVEPTEPPVPPLSAMDLQLFSAVYHSDAQAVVTCLEKRAHVNAVVRDQTGDHKNYDMPLHVAARKGDVAVVKILLAHGADAKARNAEGGDWLGPPRPGSGLTPLGVALKEGHKEVADLLRQHGASE